jgi:hypothetical protein
MRGRVQAVPENPGAGEDQYQHMLRADKALKILKLQAGHPKNNMQDILDGKTTCRLLILTPQT